jgi:hypothetical protein|tara:strand:+ start:1339 stop:1650 length:312 start_codon:yes stop_codon:yes gene_type:complete
MPLYNPDGKKQKPIIRDGIGFYSHATCPTAVTKTKRPSYVIINQPGVYKFSYENTPSTYITGSNLVDDNGPIKLDIQPTAWARTAAGGNGDLGDVTFVYRRVS